MIVGCQSLISEEGLVLSKDLDAILDKPKMGAYATITIHIVPNN